MLDQQGDVHCQAGQHLHPQFEAAEGADGLFPLVLAFALGVVDLHRVQAGQGFDQAGLALGAQGHGSLHGRHQRLLQRIADQQGNRERQHRNPHQVPADNRDDHEDQQGERQVDQAGEGQRSKEVPQALELMDVLGKAADPRRAVFHGHADDALEQRRRDDQVGFLARQVQAQAAQHLEDQVEDIGAGDTNGQYPQSRFGLVRHHAVVDVHHEQRRGHGDDVDQQARRDGIGVQPAGPFEGVAKPRTRPRDQRAVVNVKFMLRLGEEHLAAVVIGQQFTADGHLTAVAFAEQQPRLVVANPAQQHGTAAVLEQQQRWHGDGRDLLKLALQHPTLQTGTGRRARQ